ncbi:NAD(P)/FAD-dependent oxidoreductase [Hydrogenophaga crocea]|uniref:Oxidoreductase n=1 Tax=Hydrogenophaga crocea TaxID=2716225 RepID=A0A6G8IKA0_9BURK|nr:FAD-dependent oxidoreductase [Hydrogenophaga crocea]QIM53456.1 oxidoreductase [Hydrogenophaga crocea]
MASRIVIVGTGQGGFQLAASLREAGHEGPITMVGDEPGLPYQRPPLSKAFLKGTVTAEGLLLRPAALYERLRLEVLSPVRVEAIDRAAHCARLSNGQTLPYDHLVLATGARVRWPDVPGASLKGLFGLRTLADAQALRERIGQAQRIAVVGAGFIGLELAAVARALGREIDVIEAAERPLQRALSTRMAQYLIDWHVSQGARLHFGARLAGFEGGHGDDGQVQAVQLVHGERIAADLVVIAIGVTPNDQLARDAGLATDNGIAVDEQLLTADPAISALGDCANFPWRGERVRIESVQAAVDQARHIATRLRSCTGAAGAPYDKLPWFWSEQGACRLQIAGLARPDDEARIDGDPDSDRFSVQRWRDGQLVAVESLNDPSAHMRARKALTEATLALA